MTRPHRLQAVIVVAVSVLGLVATGGPAQAQAARCFAVDVRGLSVQAARTALAARGCLPGSAKDGRHFVVRTRCAPVAQFGLIVAQRPVGRTLGRTQVLTLWKGIRGAAGDPQCSQLPDTGAGTANDGRYVGTFTVTTTSNPDIYPVGGKVTGITFDVADGRLSGDVTGTIVGGASADAAYAISGTRCDGAPPGLTFGNGLAHAAAVTCRDEFATVTGEFTAWRG